MGSTPCSRPFRCRRASRSPAWPSTARATRRCWPPGSSHADGSLLLISRYTPPEMARIWSEQRKLETWLEVELAVSEALAEAGVIPAEDFEQIRERVSLDAAQVKERERITGHDVAAFVDVVGASIGEAGRWFHSGLTSSDVL